MTDERVTDEASAASCTLSSGGVDASSSAGPSPSPSPTPTFSGTGRPQRRARRLRWQAGVSRPMMALSAFSLALMVAGAVGYACKAPGMLSRPAVAPLNPLGLVLAASASDGGALSASASSAQAHAVGPVAVQGAAAQTSAADAALGLGAQGTALGAASLVMGASAVDSSFTQAVEASKASESAKADSGTDASGSSDATTGSSSSGGSESGGSSSGGASSDSPSAGDSSSSGGSGGSAADPSPAPAPSGPTEAEEAQVHAMLVDHLSRVNTYVARLNNAITAFGNDAMYGSMATRQADYDECAAIDSQTLTDFLTLRNASCPDGSRWAEQKSNLQRAYIAIDDYLTVYYNAWVLNLEYDNPAEGTDRWMESIRADQAAGGGTSAKAAQLNEVLASISL